MVHLRAPGLFGARLQATQQEIENHTFHRRGRDAEDRAHELLIRFWRSPTPPLTPRPCCHSWCGARLKSVGTRQSPCTWSSPSSKRQQQQHTLPQQTHRGHLPRSYWGRGAKLPPCDCEQRVPLDERSEKIRVIRGKTEPGYCFARPQDPGWVFGNYSSLWHLSLAKTDPARRPDISETTVSGACVSAQPHHHHPPSASFLSARTTHTTTHTHKAPPVPGAAQPHKELSMPRDDTWHSRLCSSAPSRARRPSEIPPPRTHAPPQVKWERRVP